MKSDPSRFARALLLIAVGTPLPSARGLDLVRDGRPAATVVSHVAQAEPEGRPGKRRGQAHESDEALAVRTLVEWVKKITGAELPVAAAAPGGPAVFIGDAAGLNLDGIDSPSHEGLRIVADDHSLRIAGQSEGATLKAVCRFLEELGCRYLMDGPLGEVYPHASTLAVGRLDITEKPGLLWRNPKGPSWNARLWKAWNGAGGEPFGHAHSWGSYVKPSEFAEHPEYFAMGPDGQRKAGGWLCTSNQALRDRFAHAVRAAIDAGTRHPSLSPTDGRGYCQCPGCRAQDDPASVEPSSGAVSMTNRYVDFFDAIGRQVGETHPGSVLSFYCYADYTQPPTARRALAPNLCAMIAPIRYCRLHPLGHPGCPSRQQQVAMLDGWAAAADRLGYYNYMYNLADGTLPMFKFSACAKEFPWLAAKGLTYMTIEVLSNWHIYGPQIYLSLRLAYDPRADAAAIMEDYWTKFFGAKAAPHMKDYWMGIDAGQQQLATHAGGFFGLAQLYTPEFLAECECRLAMAAAAAETPVQRQRVALHTEGLRSARSYAAICDAMSRGDFAAALRESDATGARLRDLAANGGANREYATAYLERFLAKVIRAGAEATAAPNRLLAVLPDRWRFCTDDTDTGNEQLYHTTGFDDSAWPEVATWSTTLDTQGHDRNTVLWYRTRLPLPEGQGRLALFFAEIDGTAEVYLNGHQLAIPELQQKAAKPGTPPGKPPRAGMAKERVPFEVDLSAAAQPGDNLLAVRVDHTRITELALGGILRPVLLIAKR